MSDDMTTMNPVADDAVVATPAEETVEEAAEEVTEEAAEEEEAAA
jgi:hypothetical protein